ncbi:MAG: asparagine synthetase B family protein [Candidatus Bathycorpusculaceae bacterium]
MAAIIAVLNKRGDNALDAAVAMLKMLGYKEAEAFGIASPNEVKIEKSVEALQGERIKSPIIIGHIFSKILDSDKPQPIMLKGATLVFDGRIYPRTAGISDAEAVAEKIQKHHEKNIKTLIQRIEGDFALAVAEPKRIVAERDAIGLRPLYYGESTYYAALASERKALWKIGIENVNSFPPGHMAFIDREDFKFEPVKTFVYWKTKQISMQAAAKKLRVLLHHSVEERVAGLKEVAVAFSGGLDSSIIALLAKNSGVNVKLIHVSLKNQPETKHAEKAAEAMNLPIYSYIYEKEKVAEILPKVLWLIEETNPIKTCISIPFYWVAERTAEMKIKILLAGQGADELFGGYKRYVKDYSQHGSKKVQEKMFNDVAKMYEKNLERDFKICNFHNLELRLPFATYSIAKFAIRLPVELKIKLLDDGLQKAVLRHVGEKIGLPQFIAKRQKRAIQYSTGVNKALKKLAKNEGLSQKEYLKRIFQTVSKRIMENA